MKQMLLFAIAILCMNSCRAKPDEGTLPGKKHSSAEQLYAESTDFKDAVLISIDGDTLNISDYFQKGAKYVLLDFWASWCGPCCAEIPNVKKVYETYKDKGLQVVGISVDQNSAAWKATVKRLGMTWPQTNQNNGIGRTAGEIYGVQYIPYTVLFDAQGNIIATELRGEELNNKIAELLQ